LIRCRHYFSGHGTQWSDKNFLLSNEFVNPKPGAHLNSEAINVQHVLDDISNKRPYFVMLLLDCCRDYYQPNTAGRKTSAEDKTIQTIQFHEEVEAGSLIVFARAPETYAYDGSSRNGVFTLELLQHIDKPNMCIEEIMTNVCNGVYLSSHKTQRPFWISSLTKFGVKLNQNGNNYNGGYNYNGQNNSNDTNIQRYTIRSGDTFWDLSIKFGCSLDDILNANPGVVPTRLMPGQIVNIPVTNGY